MSDNRKDGLKDLIGAIGLFIFLTLEIVLVYWALFGQGGAEQEANLWVLLISVGSGLYGGLLIILLKLGRFIVITTNSEKKYGWIDSVVHDTEDSDLPVKTKGFKWLKSPLIMSLFFIILFSILNLVQVYQNTFFTALPQRVPQQITETAQGILSTIPADQEIWIPIALGGLLIGIFNWMGKTKRVDIAISKTMIYFLIPILYTLFWYGMHLFHHGDSDISLLFVGIFGLVSGILLVVFRSVIPILILKILNNLYQHFAGVIESNEMILWITVGLNIFVLLLLILIITLKAKLRKPTGA